MLSPIPRFVVAVVLLGACRPGSRDETSWSCWPDSVCFATTEMCQRANLELKLGTTCVAKPTAFCRHGCDPRQATPGRPSCSPSCAVDREACELNDHRTTPCVEERPPAHPELFPRYSEPGWWCWELHGPNGDVSSCEKAKETCDWELDNTLATLGRTRATAGVVSGRVECRRPEGAVYCWSRRIDDQLAFVCTLTQSLCEGTLAKARQIPDPVPGHRHEIASGCAVWAFD